MARPKRTKVQRDCDCDYIAEAVLRGKPHHEIARELGLSRQQIDYDVRSIQRAWQDSAVTDMGLKFAEQLAKIDGLEHEYWKAWEESKEPLEIIERINGMVKVTRKNRDGNVLYLRGVQWCIEQRCLIFGLYAPTKLTIAELDELIEAELKRAKEYVN